MESQVNVPAGSWPEPKAGTPMRPICDRKNLPN
jgi:hypothetical protein